MWLCQAKPNSESCKKKKKTSLLVSRLSVCLTFCCIHRLISTTGENACKQTLLKVKFVIGQINDRVSSLKYYPHHQTWCRSCLVMCFHSAEVFVFYWDLTHVFFFLFMQKPWKVRTQSILLRTGWVDCFTLLHCPASSHRPKLRKDQGIERLGLTFFLIN